MIVKDKRYSQSSVIDLRMRPKPLNISFFNVMYHKEFGEVLLGAWTLPVATQFALNMVDQLGYND